MSKSNAMSDHLGLTIPLTEPGPGDWVSFYREARIVYAQIEYRRKRVGLCDEFCTTAGSVGEDYVLEVRRKP